MLVLVLVIVLLSLLLWIVWRRCRLAVRAKYIRQYRLPPGLFAKLQKRRPELDLKQCELVAQALRQFFLAYLNSGCQYVAMPSQVVDELWHELILYTRYYQYFCNKAFGQFLHHTPAVVLSADKRNNTGLRRCWRFACQQENIHPRQPSRLPLLFAIDQKLNIADGFFYHANCAALRQSPTAGADSTYCGGDFSDSSFDGSVDGLSDSGSAEGGSDAGGDGCGGGCGGD